jgi:hypothetical protein
MGGCISQYFNYFNDLIMKTFRVLGDWTDENNKLLLCEIEGGVA